jgi:hypothetical protein
VIYNKPVLLEDGRTVIADENYVRESILNPTAKIVNGFKPVMPTFQGIVSDEQLNALVAYVKSLASHPREPPGCRTSRPLPRHNPRIRRCNSHGEYSNSGESGSGSTPKLNYLNNGHTSSPGC